MNQLQKIHLKKPPMIDKAQIDRVHEHNMQTLRRFLDHSEAMQQVIIRQEAEERNAGTEEA